MKYFNIHVLVQGIIFLCIFRYLSTFLIFHGKCRLFIIICSGKFSGCGRFVACYNFLLFTIVMLSLALPHDMLRLQKLEEKFYRNKCDQNDGSFRFAVQLCLWSNSAKLFRDMYGNNTRLPNGLQLD